MIKRFFFLFLVTTSLHAQNITDTTAFNLNSHDLRMVHNWRFQSGDNPEWAKPSFVDSSWLVGNPNRLPQIEPGVHWLRTRIHLTGEQNPYDVLVLRFSKLPVAFEVYWDGSLVGENGQVGLNQADEIPGNVSYLVKLPRQRTEPGTHLLGIRFSNFHNSLQLQEFWAIVAYYSDWILTRANDLHLQYLWLGIYLTATFLSLALFLGGGRHRAFFIFAIYSFLLSLYLSINPINEVYNINIVFFEFLFKFRYIVFLSAGILLNIFFIYHFNIPHKKIHFPLVISIPLLIDILQIRYLMGIEWRDTIMELYSIGLLIYAVKQRKAGSLIALFGVLTFTMPAIYGNLNVIFHFLPKLDQQIVVLISFIFIPCIILSISRQIREQNRLYEAAKNRSHRLETQLLKSQIQPHFISNTLHSIKSWFREDPKRAEKLIQTLSDEFRIINKISSETIISIEEEIHLCQYHLEIMGSRRDVRFELITENIPEDEEVPPLIFHTLIENGLTHAYLPRENGRFWLQYEKNGREILYRLKNDGSQLQRFSEQENWEIEEGLGLTYIKARLEERFPSRWKIEYGLKNGFWEVNIHIKK
ncbi:MAG: histidine kinase [bacterium]|nr:MAG: histidine kinase [bacterium]